MGNDTTLKSVWGGGESEACYSYSAIDLLCLEKRRIKIKCRDKEVKIRGNGGKGGTGHVLACSVLPKKAAVFYFQNERSFFKEICLDPP